jgi:propanediol dehydratase large subunit
MPGDRIGSDPIRSGRSRVKEFDNKFGWIEIDMNGMNGHHISLTDPIRSGPIRSHHRSRVKEFGNKFGRIEK